MVKRQKTKAIIIKLRKNREKTNFFNKEDKNYNSNNINDIDLN